LIAIAPIRTAGNNVGKIRPVCNESNDKVSVSALGPARLPRLRRADIDRASWLLLRLHMRV
jgi:hypothetical protein